MAEADFDEKAFDMIGPNAPQDVKDAWMEAAKNVNANGMGKARQSWRLVSSVCRTVESLLS